MQSNTAAMEVQEDKSKDERFNTRQKSKRTAIVAFAVMGFLIDFFFAINISVSQDILEGTEIPTSVVLLAASAPACLSTVLYPYFSQRIPVLVASCVIFIFSVTGMLLTSLIQDPAGKLTGVCLTSFGYGSGEAVFCSLTSCHGGMAMNSYALGSGTSFLAAPLSYMGLTMLVSLSPEMALLLLITLWILFPISYVVIAEEERKSRHLQSTTFKEIPYSPIEENPNNTPESKLSLKDMLALVWKTLLQFISLLTSCISKMLLVNGVITTIAFNNVSVTLRDQYLFYVLASGIGDFIGRPYLLYLSLCGMEDKFTVNKTWILAFLNVSFLILMVLVSWFRFLSNFFAAVGIVMMNSFLSGVVYASTFKNAGDGLGVAQRMFCRALLAGALWTANITVALIGLDTEARLREHCLLLFPEDTCFTRSTTN